MARRFAALFLLLLSCAALAEESYLGLFMQGQKIGYVASSSSDEVVGGQKLKRSDSKTIIKAGLLGDALTVSIVSQTWSNAAGSPQLMKFFVDSAGRSQRTEASFSKESIHIVNDNNGQVTQKKLVVPTDAKIVDDAMMTLLDDGVPAGSERIYYVLDPMTSTLVKNRAKLVGPQKVSVNGKEFDSTLIEISEPRATTKVFVSAKGDLIKAEAFAGITMVPISKEEALAEGKEPPRIDLATVTRIAVDKPLGNLDTLTSSQLRVRNASLERAPSDGHQTLKQVEGSWIVDVHPVASDSKSKVSIAQAAKQKPDFLRSGLNIPAESAEFRELAKTVVGKASNPWEGAQRVHKYVHGLMKPNAGIGVLRDASEVLKTKEGVCRDYAILTATLMRAAQVPSRLASGLVYSDGAFYYHAWVEYWNGKNWVGLDTTRPSGKVTPGHIKLAHGSVEEAFLFTFLDKAKIDVVSLMRPSSPGGALVSRP